MFIFELYMETKKLSMLEKMIIGSCIALPLLFVGFTGIEEVKHNYNEGRIYLASAEALIYSGLALGAAYFFEGVGEGIVLFRRRWKES